MLLHRGYFVIHADRHFDQSSHWAAEISAAWLNWHSPVLFHRFQNLSSMSPEVLMRGVNRLKRLKTWFGSLAAPLRQRKYLIFCSDNEEGHVIIFYYIHVTGILSLICSKSFKICSPKVVSHISWLCFHSIVLLLADSITFLHYPPWKNLYKIDHLGVRFYRDEAGRPVFTIECVPGLRPSSLHTQKWHQTWGIANPVFYSIGGLFPNHLDSGFYFIVDCLLDFVTSSGQ